MKFIRPFMLLVSILISSLTTPMSCPTFFDLNHIGIDLRMEIEDGTSQLTLTSQTQYDAIRMAIQNIDLLNSVAPISEQITDENIEGIMQEIINKMPQLRYLEINNSNITRLPNSICRFRYLSHLDLSRNQLETIPASLSRLTTLQALNLNNNNFSEVTNVLCEMPQLKRISLSGNPLSRFPHKFANLENLENVSIPPYIHQYERLGDMPWSQTITDFLLQNEREETESIAVLRNNNLKQFLNKLKMNLFKIKNVKTKKPTKKH